MTKPKCSYCESEDVAWRQAKNGHFYLIDTVKPHFCKARKKSPATARRQPLKSGDGPAAPDQNPIQAEVVAGLVRLGYKEADATRYVLAAGEAADAYSLTLAALAVRGAEMEAQRKGSES